MADIKVIKLCSGEEIIGVIELNSENHEETLVRNSMKIVYEYDDKKRPHVFLYDWIPAAVDEVYPIKNVSMMTAPLSPHGDLEDLYVKISIERTIEHNEFDNTELDSIEDLDDVSKSTEDLIKKLMKDDFEDDDDLQ